MPAGAQTFTVYNHMLLPMRYTSSLDEYEALITGVTIWDVGAERQVEIQGPDAAALTQYLCTRDVSRIRPGQACYTFVCNHAGGILNDPVLLKLAEDHYWLSLADSDVLLWAQAIAAERGMDVAVREPDVSPLQVQGPKSGDLIGDVFGPDTRDQKYYNFVETELDGVPMVVARTGWSGEFGYEVFLRDGPKGTWLWDRLFAAGESHGVKPASPNQIRRIEGGILSYGTDMDQTVTPLELGFGRFVQFDGAEDFVGKAALLTQAARGIDRRLTGIRIGGDPVLSNSAHMDVQLDGRSVARLTSMVYSPRFDANLGFAFVELGCAAPGCELEIITSNGGLLGIAEAIPFVEPTKSI
ncbi:MAG: glycine cleavage system protein T [bacterium]|nr:glycine cleavage system protein T [bacterium]